MEQAEEGKPETEVQYSPTATPILDVLRLVSARPRRQLGAGAYFLVSSSLMVLLVGLATIQAFPSYWFAQPDTWSAWQALCLAIVAVLLASVAHQAGHLVAGRLAGFHLRWFEAGSWSLGGGAAAARAIGPVVLTNETLIREASRKQLMAALLSAPVLGLLLSLFAETMNVALSVSVPGRIGLHVFALASVLIAVASLLPDVSTRGNYSDGARLLMMLRKDSRAERWLAILELQRKLGQGELPKSWDPQVVARALAVKDDTADALLAHCLAHRWSAGIQDISAATRHLEEALALLGNARVILRDQLFLEAAIFQGWFRSNPAKARYWIARVSRLKKLAPLQRSRFEAAVLWAEGKLFEGWEKLGEGLVTLRHLPESPARSIAERSLQDWKYQMESRMLTRAWRSMSMLAQNMEGVEAGPADMPERAL
ncbi:MAG TPA: hypothetical protein VEW69_10075 [Alphaproteobacteria bacterium]|nr:hypothetical protein [Alphaproteobacteria bacterium]